MNTIITLILLTLHMFAGQVLGRTPTSQPPNTGIGDSDTTHNPPNSGARAYSDRDEINFNTLMAIVNEHRTWDIVEIVLDHILDLADRAEGAGRRAIENRYPEPGKTAQDTATRIQTDVNNLVHLHKRYYTLDEQSPVKGTLGNLVLGQLKRIVSEDYPSELNRVIDQANITPSDHDPYERSG